MTIQERPNAHNVWEREENAAAVIGLSLVPKRPYIRNRSRLNVNVQPVITVACNRMFYEELVDYDFVFK